MNNISLNLHHYLVVIAFSSLILLPIDTNAALIDIKSPKPDSCSTAVILQGDSEAHAYDNGGNTVIFYIRHSFSENIGAPWGSKACSVFIPSLNEYRYGYSYIKSIPADGCSDKVYNTTSASCATPCMAGEVRNSTTNACELIPEVCPDSTFTGHIPAGSAPSIVCVDGCQATIISASNQFAVSGAQVIAGTWEYVGGEKSPSCTGAVATVGDLSELSEAPKCEVSECLDQVNDQWVCVPCSQATTPNTIYDVGKTTTTDSLGTTSVMRDEETSLDSAGVTQTTIITNTDVVGESSTDLSGITPVSISSIGLCPPDVLLPLGLNFSWQGICDSTDMLKPIILVLLLLAIGIIIIRVFKRVIRFIF